MIIPPIGPHNFDSSEFSLGIPETPQKIFAEEKGEILQLRKQDNKLGVELTLEALEITKQALIWVKMAGMGLAEIDQAVDILSAKQLEIEGK